MRLIDADALAKFIDYGHLNSPDAKVYSENDIREMIDMMPTIDKKVEVVRCMDCKHSEYWYADKCRCFLWHEHGIDVFSEGFCNYGEEVE